MRYSFSDISHQIPFQRLRIRWCLAKSLSDSNPLPVITIQGNIFKNHKELGCYCESQNEQTSCSYPISIFQRHAKHRKRSMYILYMMHINVHTLYICWLPGPRIGGRGIEVCENGFISFVLAAQAMIKAMLPEQVHSHTQQDNGQKYWTNQETPKSWMKAGGIVRPSLQAVTISKDRLLPLCNLRCNTPRHCSFAVSSAEMPQQTCREIW